jgi:hypothetical protein
VHRRALLALPALALAFLVAGCGGGGGSGGSSSSKSSASAGTPSLGTLLGDMVAASKSQHSAHYSIDLTVSVEGTSSNPQLQLLASKPIKLHLDGDASKSALSANGSISALGKDFSAKFLANSSSLYLNVLGTWYGSSKFGLDKLTKYGNKRIAPAGTSQLQSEQQLRQHADEILTGTISDGPTLDGVSTWEFKGKLNADGLATLSAQKGKTLTSQQKDVLKVVQDSTNVTLDIGKDDHLIRNFDFGLDLTADQLKTLSQSVGSSSTASTLNGLSAVHFSFTLGLSKWGEAVTITPPSSFQPLSALLKSFAGLVGGGSAAGY